MNDPQFFQVSMCQIINLAQVTDARFIRRGHGDHDDDALHIYLAGDADGRASVNLFGAEAREVWSRLRLLTPIGDQERYGMPS